MIKLTIHKPVWNERKVGIADFRVKGNDMVELTIDYKDVDGNLLYPFTYHMHSSKIRQYPTQTIKSGIKLYLVPIDDWAVE